MVTVWSPQAIAELKKAFEYISQTAPNNAKKLVTEITDLADKVSEQPEMFPADKFKKNNDGSWRAFEKYHYRISYRITKKDIRIIRMRHTSMSPLQY